MKYRIEYMAILLMIIFILFAGCHGDKQETPIQQEVEGPPEVELIPIVQVPQGKEKPDPVETPNQHVSSPPVANISFPALSDFREIFGAPDIFEDGVCYYMGSWNPGGTLMMLLFVEDTITACETLTYNEDVLYTYIPHLIESIQNADRDVANQALDFLTNVMQLTYPNGYYEKYRFTEDPYKGTPFEKNPPVWHENAYQQWKAWWNTEGQKDFERMVKSIKP